MFSLNDPLLHAEYDDEESLYERQALIHDDNSFCDEGPNKYDEGRMAIRQRQQTEKGRQPLTSNGYELTNLKTTKEVPSEHNIEFTYYDIQPGDSLRSICLRYACPTELVKRINGLMNDQDFYGLKCLKLPLGKLGLLEDHLKQQQGAGSRNLLIFDENEPRNKQRMINSPGSALSVRNKQSRFRPLLSPGYSSDRVDKIVHNRPVSSRFGEFSDTFIAQPSLQNNSHSFSSLREFANGDINIAINNSTAPPCPSLEHHQHIKPVPPNLIKCEIRPDPSQITVDSLLTSDEPTVNNVFEDLDYHVERAKAAAERYEKRAAELVNGIESATGDAITARFAPARVSKIPELFFSGENFGLNLKRLIILIFFVCLVIPLVYMSQTEVAN